MNEHKFDGMGQVYAQFRPSYPQAFITYLYADVLLRADSVLADIGAGTGILTRQLLEQGSLVYAVEPNPDMRAVAEADLNGFKNFVSINGTAEKTTLAADSIDCITVAQAFHWFDRPQFQKECRRILKTDGKAVLVWNSRDFESELVQENDAVNRKYCPNFKGFIGGMRGAVDEGDFDDFFVGGYETKAFAHPLQFDKQGFIGRNLSASYALKENDSDYKAYIAQLGVLFEKYAVGNTLIMPNITRCYVGSVQ